MLDELENPVK